MEIDNNEQERIECIHTDYIVSLTHLIARSISRILNNVTKDTVTSNGYRIRESQRQGIRGRQQGELSKEKGC
jgi:hypothetical protein